MVVPPRESNMCWFYELHGKCGCYIEDVLVGHTHCPQYPRCAEQWFEPGTTTKVCYNCRSKRKQREDDTYEPYDKEKMRAQRLAKKQAALRRLEAMEGGAPGPDDFNEASAETVAVHGVGPGEVVADGHNEDAGGDGKGKGTGKGKAKDDDSDERRKAKAKGKAKSKVKEKGKGKGKAEDQSEPGPTWWQEA